MGVQINRITDEVTRDVQSVLGGRLRNIILYGSYARGDFDNESDVDIMVLADLPSGSESAYRKSISRIAGRIGLEHDVMVSISLKNKEFFESRTDVLPFYKNVLNEGVALYGD